MYSTQGQTHRNDKGGAPQGTSGRAVLSIDGIAGPQLHPELILQRAQFDPGSLTAGDKLWLQRMIGNRAVGRLLEGAGMHTNQTTVPVSDKAVVLTSNQAVVSPKAGGKFSVEGVEEVQRVADSSRGKDVEPLQWMAEISRHKETTSVQRRENHSGMRDGFKTGLVDRAGMDINRMREGYHLDMPLRIGALVDKQGAGKMGEGILQMKGSKIDLLNVNGNGSELLLRNSGNIKEKVTTQLSQPVIQRKVRYNKKVYVDVPNIKEIMNVMNGLDADNKRDFRKWFTNSQIFNWGDVLAALQEDNKILPPPEDIVMDEKEEKAVLEKALKSKSSDVEKKSSQKYCVKGKKSSLADFQNSGPTAPENSFRGSYATVVDKAKNIPNPPVARPKPVTNVEKAKAAFKKWKPGITGHSGTEIELTQPEKDELTDYVQSKGHYQIVEGPGTGKWAGKNQFKIIHRQVIDKASGLNATFHITTS